MKAKDIPSLEIKVMGMLPITQSEIWKCLGMGHRDGSALVSIMLGENLIKKTRFNHTFLVERKDEDSDKGSPLLSKDGKFSPCCGCERECEPKKCESLTQWLE